MHEDDDQRNEQEEVEQARRDFLKGGAAAAGAGLAAATVPGVSAEVAGDNQPENPYGPRPGGGISTPVRTPVWILYLTASVEPDGRMRFLKDVYNRDARLLDALDGPVRTEPPEG